PHEAALAARERQRERRVVSADARISVEIMLEDSFGVLEGPRPDSQPDQPPGDGRGEIKQAEQEAAGDADGRPRPPPRLLKARQLDRRIEPAAARPTGGRAPTAGTGERESGP